MNQSTNSFAKKVNSSYLYSKFLAKIIFKKNSSIVLPVVLMGLIIILTLIARFVSKDLSTFLIISYVNIFITLFLSVIFASIKALNIFKDLAKEGIDILVFSKSISRQNVIITKLGFFCFIGVLWSIVAFLGGIIFYASNYPYAASVNYWYVSTFFSTLFTYLLFGLIAILIALKQSSKIAMITPIMVFLPLLVAGSAANVFSTSSANQIASFLNLEKREYDSGTVADVEKFYLNNNKDEYILIPKINPEDASRKKFTQRQVDLLNQIYSHSKSSAVSWQAISWLFIPYQLIDVFAQRDKDPIGVAASREENNLKNYLYYNDQPSKEFNYFISDNPLGLSLKPVVIDNQESQRYIVPGLLKNRSIISEQSDFSVQDREIIYAREKANDVNVTFAEDNNIFASPDNLVGKIKWSIVKDALESPVFLEKAKDFYETRLQSLEGSENLTKAKILEIISNIASAGYDKTFINLVDKESGAELFKEIINPREIKNQTEKKIYLITTMLYYLYFNHQDSVILDKILKNDNEQNGYAPQKIKVFVDGHNYFIGGYKNYAVTQYPKEVTEKDSGEGVVRERKIKTIVYRYELEDSDNYLFQAVEEVKSVQQANRVISKGFYSLIWIAIVAALLVGAYFGYTRKDYK